MKKSLLFFLAVFAFYPVFAQDIREMTLTGKPRKLDSGEMIARRDQNGNYCAAIQVISAMDGLTYDSYNGIVGNIDDNPGKDIIYLTASERVLEVLKSGYKPLKIILSEYGIVLKPTEIWQIEISGDKMENQLPVTLLITPEDARLTIDTEPVENSGTHNLSVGSHIIGISKNGFQSIEDTIVISEKKVYFHWSLEKLQSQWLVITSEPDSADVYLDDQPVGKTPFQNEILVGNHKWKLTKELYLPDSGNVELLASAKSVLDLILRQNYGTLRLSSIPDSSDVSINGVNINRKTPCTIEKVPAGECEITLSLKRYGSITQTIQLNPRETKNLDITLNPDFGTINLISSPENGAIVSLNGMNTGKKTPCTLEVPAGESTITLNLNMYETTTKKINLVAGEIKDLAIPLKPTFAVVNVTSDPACEIHVNGALKGNGTWQGRLTPGIYTFLL